MVYVWICLGDGIGLELCKLNLLCVDLMAVRDCTDFLRRTLLEVDREDVLSGRCYPALLGHCVYRRVCGQRYHRKDHDVRIGFMYDNTVM